MNRLFKDRFFWYVTILVAFVGILTVYSASLPTTFVEEWRLVYIPMQRLAFAIAVLVSSWRFGSRAGWLVCFIAGLFILARHVFLGVTGLSQSEVMDILVELGVILLGILTSWFIGRYQEGTQRLQQSERNLRQAAEEWRTTFDSITEPVSLLSKDFRILRVNKAYANFFNGKPQKLIGKTCYEVAHGTTEPVLGCPHRKAMENKKPASAELYNSDKETFWEVSASPIFDEKGDVIASVHITRDITERKRAEEALRQREERHRTILQTAMDGFWMSDMDGRILEVNETYCRMSGYSAQELLAMHISDLEAAEMASDTTAHMRNIVEKGEHRFESRHRRKDGSLYDVEISVQYQPDKSGQFISFCRDVTKHKLAEVESQQLRDKAEISSRLASVGEMAAGIAHEINNPLTGVIGFSEILLTENLPPEIKEQLRIIADGSQRVKDIVKRMLTFARQNKPMKISANIHELIDNTLGIRSYVLKTANIEVIRDYDPSLPWITADPSQLQQVFLNLIVNAEYAMKKAHDKGNLTITTEAKDKHIRISFRDDGPGMSPEIIKKLFNPFFTTKDPGEGTGLGLSLSRSIILEHNGTIGVESEPGKGANFIITLPVTLTMEEAISDTTADTTALIEKVRAARILVVDDEYAIRTLVSKILATSGHTVDTTGEPEVVLLKLENTSYDVVILDMRMPDMSGMELYAKIIEKHPELTRKVIFITGDTSDLDVRDYLNQNDLPYISKPFDRETLIQNVRRLL